VEILTVDNPLLRRKCRPVRRVTARVRAQLGEMIETMRRAEGVGLAAPQVGILRRMIVVDVGNGPIELVNPELVEASGSAVGVEGCLSVPGWVGEVERAARVRVRGLDENGRKVWIDGEGLLSRALQHEIDHLDGILFVDKAKNVMREEEFRKKRERLRVVFMGTPEFAVPSLRALEEAGYAMALVVTRPDARRGRGMCESPPPVKQAAEEMGLEVVQPENLRDPELEERLKDASPDVIAVVAYGRILPPRILRLPRLGCVNLHASLLPRYRGPAPIHWAVINGEDETGVTTILMDEGEDTGDIIMQRSTPVSPDDTAGSLHDRLAEMGAELLCETLSRLARGEARPRPQEGPSSRAPGLRPEHERIDWGASARDVANLVRGLEPWPGAYTTVAGRRLKIRRGRAVSGSDPSRSNGPRPGEVLGAGDEGILVACGRGGAYLVEEVQPDGGRRMRSRDYLRGHPLRAGVLLGEGGSGSKGAGE